MKKSTMKKLTALALSGLLALGLAACGQEGGGETAKLGVIQYATHASLDNCYAGFLEGLAEGGYVDGENLTIEFQNANADPAACDLMAKNMVSEGSDMVMGIATPAAMSLYGAARGTEIPVIFTAVSDPVGAGIVESLAAPGYNCTGASDELDLAAQVAMIRAFLPNASIIGVIYTASETNSVTQLAVLEEVAPQYGFEVRAVSVTNAAEVATAAASLVSAGVDCINNFTDNLVVENLSQVLNAANEAGIPVFGSEEEQVKNGCLACQGIDYLALGREAGRMAAKVLSSQANAAELAVYVTSEYSPFYNSAVAASLGLSVPAEYANAVDVAAE